jgi:hypothetical protein
MLTSPRHKIYHIGRFSRIKGKYQSFTKITIAHLLWLKYSEYLITTGNLNAGTIIISSVFGKLYTKTRDMDFL